MPTIAQWDINDFCNLNCKHCRISKKQIADGELTLKEGKELLAQLWYNGVTMLNISGGEPFLRKDLFELLEYSNKFQDIVITTNCTLISESECKKMAQLPNVRLSISLDGLEKTHDMFRGKKGTFKKVINTLPLLKQYNIPYSIRYTLSKETEKDALEVLRLVASYGAKDFNVRRVIPVGNASMDMLISNEEYKNIIGDIINECKKMKIKFKTGDPTLIPLFPETLGIDLKKYDLSKIYSGCTAGDEIIYINYKGDVGACSYIPIYADNIRNNSLDKILKENKLFIDLRDYKEKLQGKCSKCSYKMICGGCRATALALKNSILEEDPTCLS